MGVRLRRRRGIEGDKWRFVVGETKAVE